MKENLKSKQQAKFKFCKSKCPIFPQSLITSQLNLPPLIQKTYFKEIPSQSWFCFAQKSLTRLIWTWNKNIQNAAATMASTYCPQKSTTDCFCTIKINLCYEEKKQPKPLPIIKAKGTSSESSGSNHKFLTKRVAQDLHPLSLGCAASVHHNWGLCRTCDSSKQFFQEHLSKDTLIEFY